MLITSTIYQQFQEGQLSSFYKEVYPSLILFAIKILGNDYNFLAEDCVQDSIYKAYLNRKHILSAPQMKSYLYTCIHNQAISLLRKRNSSQMDDAGADTTIPSLEMTIIEQETLDLLYEALSRLPDDLRTIYELFYIQKMKLTDIAAFMELSESSIKKKKAHMLQLLRDFLEKKHTPSARLLLAMLY